MLFQVKSNIYAIFLLSQMDLSLTAKKCVGVLRSLHNALIAQLVSSWGGGEGEERGERGRGEGATFNELPMWGQVSYLFRSLSVENDMNVSN